MEQNKNTGAVLSDADIKQYLSEGKLKITGHKAEKLYIGPASVDLHLAPKALVLDSKKMDPVLNPKSVGYIDLRNKERSAEMFTEVDGWKEITIYPGEFYILSTEERVELNKDTAAFVFGRSSMGRMGLNIHLAGFVDPMFCGNITLEVSNFTRYPIVVPAGVRICQIVFLKTISTAEIGYGEKKDSKYQNQSGPTVSGAHKDFI